MYICVSETEHTQVSPNSLVLTKQARLASHQASQAPTSLSVPSTRITAHTCCHTWFVLHVFWQARLDPRSHKSSALQKESPPQPCRLLSLCAYFVSPESIASTSVQVREETGEVLLERDLPAFSASLSPPPYKPDGTL